VIDPVLATLIFYFRHVRCERVCDIGRGRLRIGGCPSRKGTRQDSDGPSRAPVATTGPVQICAGNPTKLVEIMARCELVRARPFSIIAALLLVVLSVGVSGSASADPGNGNGNGAEKSAVAQADKGSSGKSAASSGSVKAQSSNAGKHSTDGHPGTSGVVTLAQPISKADANEGGANGQCTDGVYCSTRHGEPSLNGNGGGAATGKPCAGCVGKADNKNPQGQMPNARDDGNNGYECDNNNGIGKTNPAHTGCQLTRSVCVENCVSSPPLNVCVVTPTETCAPPVARPRPPADVAGVETVRPPADVAGVETVRPPADVSASPPAVLPATGSPDLLGLIGGSGMGLLMAGGLTIWLHRRNRVIS